MEAQQDALALGEARRAPRPPARRGRARSRPRRPRACTSAPQPSGPPVNGCSTSICSRGPPVRTRARQRLELRGGDALGRDPRGGGRGRAAVVGTCGRAHASGSCHGRALTPASRTSTPATHRARLPPMPFTRRRLIARAARVSGAAVAASAAPAAPRLARPRRRRSRSSRGRRCTLPDPPLRDADYLAVADEVVRRLDRTWHEEERAYSSGGARDRRDLQRRAADDPRGRRRARPRPGRRATTSARGCSPRACARRRRSSPAPRCPNPDRMFHTPGLGRRPRHARQPDGQGVRPEGGRGR